MYSLPHFKESDPAEVRRLMHEHPFIILCGSDASGKAVATHVPVLIKERNGRLLLQGHVMKDTDHHLAFTLHPEVLAIFSGPHVYVSASWYREPRQASTWNYITVHARGLLTFLDEQSLLRTLQETTAHFENNPASPALFENLPSDYVQRLSKAIIAFEITVHQIEHVFKLSQNRDEKSYHAIIEQLNKQDGDAREIAQIMQQRAGQLFEGKQDSEQVNKFRSNDMIP